MQAVTTPIKVMKEKYYKCIKGVFSDSNEQSISNIMSKNSSKCSKYLKVAAFFKYLNDRKRLALVSPRFLPQDVCKHCKLRRQCELLNHSWLRAIASFPPLPPRVQGQRGENFEKGKKRPDLILAGKLENAALLAGTYRFKTWNKVGIHCRAM